jgi:hypothetical protein
MQAQIQHGIFGCASEIEIYMMPSCFDMKIQCGDKAIQSAALEIVSI